MLDAAYRTLEKVKASTFLPIADQRLLFDSEKQKLRW